MSEIISIIKILATSNTINFIIMLILLAVIIKKINIRANFENSIELIKSNIEKSENEKNNAKKDLEIAQNRIADLPKDISELTTENNQKITAFKEKIKEDTNTTITNIEQNIGKIVSIEEQRVSNHIQSEAIQKSIELSKQQIIRELQTNPELHNNFIIKSLEELDKIKL